VIDGRSSLNRSPGTSSRPDGRHPGIQEEPFPETLHDSELRSRSRGIDDSFANFQPIGHGGAGEQGESAKTGQQGQTQHGVFL
jgi:hypothetical protein